MEPPLFCQCSLNHFELLGSVAGACNIYRVACYFARRFRNVFHEAEEFLVVVVETAKFAVGCCIELAECLLVNVPAIDLCYAHEGVVDGVTRVEVALSHAVFLGTLVVTDVVAHVECVL